MVQKLGIVFFSWLLIIVASFIAVPEVKATCLDYWSIGPSGCDGKQPDKRPSNKKTTSNKEVINPQESSSFIEPESKLITQPPMEEELSEEEQKEQELQGDIEKFYNRHGKPPEEFVRFYMDPTPGNALAWVKKYNEGLKRSRQLAAAWTQAQQIYTEFDKQGLEIPPELLPKHARGAEYLPPVQDLGLPLPDGMSDVFDGTSRPKTPAPFTNSSTGGISITGADAIAEDGRIGGSGALDINSDVLRVSYYFSAECPYCEKFEPVFSKIIKEYGNKIAVTCVDMTPSGQTEDNIHGKVNCEWRPLLPGEKDAMGVDATPTLIVDRGADKPLERISGFVDETKLRSYLKDGPVGSK